MEKIYNTYQDSKIFNLLFQNHVCIRCILRVFRIENTEIFCKTDLYAGLLEKVSQQLKLPQSLLENYDSNGLIYSENQKQETHSNCSVCFGVLQFAHDKKQIAEIAQEVVKEDFQFNSFKFTIKVPLSTNIRLAHLLHYVHKMIQTDKEYTKGDLEKAKTLLDINSGVIDIKTAIKWVLGPALADALGVKSASDSKFAINLQYRCPDQDQEEFNSFEKLIREAYIGKLKERMEKKAKKNIQTQNPEDIDFKEPSNTNLERILYLPLDVFMSLKTDQQGEYFPPEHFKRHLDFTLNCSHDNVYIMGSYLKFSRTLSQSPWEVDGKKLYETSIEEELANVIAPYFKPRTQVFHTGGREDIDVRMLGNGRPFVLELVDPKRGYDIQEFHFKEMEQKINVNTQVNAINLYLTNEKCFDILRQSEEKKVKAYSCVVTSIKKITQKDIDILNGVNNLKIQQKTPFRVLHKRTLMVREKTIHKLQAISINEHCMVLFVLASAGTYIKEFVHGDLERTLPNVGMLLATKADILQLDVMRLYEKYDENTLNEFIQSSKVYEPCI